MGGTQARKAKTRTGNIVRYSREQFIDGVQVKLGWKRERVEYIVDAVIGTVKDWMIDNIQTITTDHTVDLQLPGFGSWTITCKPIGRRNPAKLAAGICTPAPSVVRIYFFEAIPINNHIALRNKELAHMEGLRPYGTRRKQPYQPISSTVNARPFVASLTADKGIFGEKMPPCASSAPPVQAHILPLTTSGSDVQQDNSVDHAAMAGADAKPQSQNRSDISSQVLQSQTDSSDVLDSREVSQVESPEV